MSNSGVTLVFLLSDFRFVVIVTETTKLGLEFIVTAQSKQRVQCRAGTYCQIHGDDDTVQPFKVQFKCMKLSKNQEKC